MRLIPGQRVWICFPSREGGTRPRIVVSVGPKWATLATTPGGRPHRVTVSPDSRGFHEYDRGEYGAWIAHTDAQHLAHEQRAAVRSCIIAAKSALDNADPLIILEVCRLLGIDCPELPTADEILKTGDAR